ncbi:26446_t:CDS:2, partial [Racocetra persica]
MKLLCTLPVTILTTTALCPVPTTYVSKVPESECDPESGHTAAYPSKLEENNSLENRFFQNKSSNRSNREILDRKDKTPASSNLLVKELSATVFKEFMEPHTDNNTTTKASRNKSLFEDTVENKLDNSQTVGKGYGQGPEFCKGLRSNTSQAKMDMPSTTGWCAKLDKQIVFENWPEGFWVLVFIDSHTALVTMKLGRKHWWQKETYRNLWQNLGGTYSGNFWPSIFIHKEVVGEDKAISKKH